MVTFLLKTHETGKEYLTLSLAGHILTASYYRKYEI